jgi:L-histidine N-alpha-methyltransferase
MAPRSATTPPAPLLSATDPSPRGAACAAEPDAAIGSHAPQWIDLHPAAADLRQLVLEGMARRPRQLPAWLLYDAEGSRLFEAITEQPEYTLTRQETALLEQRAAVMAQAMAAGLSRAPVLVEFGAGNLRKVSPLLTALSPAAFAALDISADHLAPACGLLQQQHPAVPVLGVCCDYSQLDALPDHPLLAGRPRLGFYPGSSLGNFEPAEARGLLARFRRLLGPQGRLLIGIDQPRDVALMEAAYDDAAGVSAAFAFNLLHRLNRELDGDFEPDAFHYRAWWDQEHSRIAMALVSLRAQIVSLAGAVWRFEEAEPLISETSVKYSPEAFLALAASAGWRPMERWGDPGGQLSLHLLGQADSEEQRGDMHHEP